MKRKRNEILNKYSKKETKKKNILVVGTSPEIEIEIE